MSKEKKEKPAEKSTGDAIKTPSEKVVKKWQIFPGRNRIYCDGRVIMARPINVFIVTIMLITWTTFVFFLCDCPYLYEHVSPLIPFGGAILLFFVMATLLRTSFIDPGIIPRATVAEDIYLRNELNSLSAGMAPNQKPTPVVKEVLINGRMTKLKYCTSCKIFRPPRASHCSTCNNCIDRFDHHCPWVGNCVGRRNYRYFYSFIVSLVLLCSYILFGITVHFRRMDKFIGEIMKENPASCVAAVICFVTFWGVIGLIGFHTYLIGTNTTTNEDIKGSFSRRKGEFNPYTYGNCYTNFCYILCGPIPPSFIDLRGIATKEEQYLSQKHKKIPPNKVEEKGQQDSAVDSSAKLQSKLTDKKC